MPLYHYKCECGAEFDEFNSVTERHTKPCSCGKTAKQEITPVRLDYYNMGVQVGLPTAWDKWEKMHKKEASRE